MTVAPYGAVGRLGPEYEALKHQPREHTHTTVAIVIVTRCFEQKK